MRLEHEQRDLEFVDAQMQDRIVELARHLQRPERGTLRDQAIEIGGRRRLGGLDRNRRRPRKPIDVDADKTVADAVLVDAAIELRQLNAFAAGVAFRGGGKFPGAIGNPGFELAVRRDLVDQAPCDGPLALDALLAGAELIGVVSAYLALIEY